MENAIANVAIVNDPYILKIVNAFNAQFLHSGFETRTILRCLSLRQKKNISMLFFKKNINFVL